jgi:hypothetical protein
LLILRLAGPASCRCLPLSSNVRPHRTNAVALLRFDPAILRNRLAAFDLKSRLAFALACSLRTANDALHFEPLAEVARRFAEDYALRGTLEPAAAQRLLAELQESPELDRDEVASAYYALDAALKDSLDSVILAAQRAYDARDALAQRTFDFSIYTNETEELLLQHPGVQHELKCQTLDLECLEAPSGGIPEVIRRARGAA